MAKAHLVVKSLTILAGAAVSDAVDLTGVRPVAVWVPVITSGELRLRGSYDTTSANFVQVMDQNASPIASRWYANVGPGSCAVSLDFAATPFPYLKLETSVTQAGQVGLVVMCKIAPVP